MKVLFIGPYSYGSTSLMRINYIKSLLNLSNCLIIDTDIPFEKTNRVFRSIGSRFKVGPLIKNINQFVFDCLMNDFAYDFIWIDKGVFLKPNLIKRLREKSRLLVHYTPDPAFTYHKSKLFYNSIELYDYCVTTKSFEIESFKNAGAKNVIYCTQGFDKQIHYPQHTLLQKDKSVSFIGHYEINRGVVIQSLIDSGIDVHIAGIKWNQFVKKNKLNNNLFYYGNGIYGSKYSEFLSSSKICLGLISKWIPELHTTRTMEIPACGSVLITERNEETQSLFLNDEVLFYDDITEVPQLVKNLLNDNLTLEKIQKNGTTRVLKDGYDYENISKNILLKIGLL